MIFSPQVHVYILYIQAIYSQTPTAKSSVRKLWTKQVPPLSYFKHYPWKFLEPRNFSYPGIKSKLKRHYDQCEH